MIIAVFDISVAFFHGEVRKVIYVVPPKDLRKKGKIWGLLKSLYGTRDASQVFATYVEEGLNDHGFQRNAVVPCLYWCAMLEALGVHWRDDFTFGIPDDRADDLEQLMREVFKVKICERIGPGFLTSVEFLHRKVGWNAEGFSWTHDPKHTLAMADGFGFNGKKQLEQTKWKITVAPGSKTVCKGLRDGADNLDEQETQKIQITGWHSTVCWTRQTRNTMCNKRSSEIHVWTNACREVYAPTFVQVLQRGTRTQLEFSTSRNAK